MGKPIILYNHRPRIPKSRTVHAMYHAPNALQIFKTPVCAALILPLQTSARVPSPMHNAPSSLVWSI